MSRVPLRIVLATSELAIGGAEVNLVNYAVELRHRGHDVRVLAGEGPLDERLRAEGIERVGDAMRLRWPRSVLAAARDLRRLAAAAPIDVVHAFMANAAVASHIARGASRFAIVTAPPGLVQDRREPRWVTSLRLRLLTLGANIVVAPTRSFGEILMAAGVHRERLRFVEFNAVPVSRFATARPDPEFRSRLGIAADAPLVCSVARLHPVKGQDLLLRAVPAVLAAEPETRFVLVGEGPWRGALEQLAKDLGVSHAVRFAGEVRDVAPVLADSSVVVQTTFGTGGPGLSVIEALASGRPVVAFEFPDLSELLSGTGAALIVPHGDLGALAASLVRVVREPATAMRLAGEGKRIARERFDLAGVVGTLEEIYAEAIALRASEQSGHRRF